jgi:hypothetical protein
MPQAKHVNIRNSRFQTDNGFKDLMLSGNGYQWTSITISKTEAKRIIRELSQAVAFWDQESNAQVHVPGATGESNEQK